MQYYIYNYILYILLDLINIEPKTNEKPYIIYNNNILKYNI